VAVRINSTLLKVVYSIFVAVHINSTLLKLMSVKFHVFKMSGVLSV